MTETPLPPASANPLDDDQDRTGQTLLAFVVIAVLCSVGVLWFSYTQSKTHYLRELSNASVRLSETLEHEIKALTFGVEILAAQAQDELAGRPQHRIRASAYLEPYQGRGYSLRIPPGSHEQDIGNITGLGELPAPQSPLAREIDMAFSLSATFRAIHQQNPETPWIYYTSARHFVYLYPRTPPQNYFFSPGLEEQEMFQAGLPSANPRRTSYWTSVYEDSAGQGSMVTVSKPVYHNDQFFGVVSTDLTQRTLARMLEKLPILHTTAHLVDRDGATVANPISLQPQELLSLPPHVPTQLGNNIYTRIPLVSAPWTLVTQTSRQAVTAEAWKQSIIHALVVVLLLASLTLLALLSRSLRRMHRLSIRDSLTGQYNRRHFNDVASRELARLRRRNNRLALIVMAIDHFNSYQAHYGQQASQRLLVQVAHRIAHLLPTQSYQVFRLDDEHLAVMTMIEHLAPLEQTLETLRSAILRQKLAHDGSPAGHVTLTQVAIVVSAGDDVYAADMVQEAIQACRLLGEQGGNAWRLIQIDADPIAGPVGTTKPPANGAIKTVSINLQ